MVKAKKAMATSTAHLSLVRVGRRQVESVRLATLATALFMVEELVITLCDYFNFDCHAIY